MSPEQIGRDYNNVPFPQLIDIPFYGLVYQLFIFSCNHALISYFLDALRSLLSAFRRCLLRPSNQYVYNG